MLEQFQEFLRGYNDVFRLKLCLRGSSTSFFGTHKCISLNVANCGPTIVHPSVCWLNKLLQLKYAFSFKLKKKIKKFMASFYGWGSTVSSLQSHY